MSAYEVALVALALLAPVACALYSVRAGRRDGL